VKTVKTKLVAPVDWTRISFAIKHRGEGLDGNIPKHSSTKIPYSPRAGYHRGSRSTDQSELETGWLDGPTSDGRRVISGRGTRARCERRGEPPTLLATLSRSSRPSAPPHLRRPGAQLSRGEARAGPPLNPATASRCSTAIPGGALFAPARRSCRRGKARAGLRTGRRARSTPLGHGQVMSAAHTSWRF